MFWIARDNDGWLFLYDEKPVKSETDKGKWKVSSRARITPLDKGLFPEIKFDDEEPTEVEIKIRCK